MFREVLLAITQSMPAITSLAAKTAAVQHPNVYEIRIGAMH